MKRALALILSFVLIAGCFGGCGEPEEILGDGDRIVICVDEEQEQFGLARDALNYYAEKKGLSEHFQVETLPIDKEERKNALQRIRAEIMAGKGPDIFIMDSDPYWTVYEDGSAAEPLFLDAEKAMSNGLFLDITEMADNSELIDLDNCLSVVMDAGVFDGRRYILPILYSYCGVYVEGDYLNDPQFSFDSVKELTDSDEDMLRSLYSLTAGNYFSYYFGDILDYENGTVKLTAEELLAIVKENEALSIAFNKKLEEVYGFNFGQGEAYKNYGIMCDMYTDEFMGIGADGPIDVNIFPVINHEGGVTANVGLYTAINANTEFPETCFDFVEFLLCETLQGGPGGFTNDDGTESLINYDYGSSHGIPVNLNSAEYYFKYCTPYTIESHKAVVERINTARIYSTIDEELDNMLISTHTYQEPWDYVPPEEIVNKLQRLMDE